MIFKEKIKETHHLSCINGEETMMKKMIINRELCEQYNIIKDVFNKFANHEKRMDNVMLFKIIFFDLLSELSSVTEEQAISILEMKAEKIPEYEKRFLKGAN